MHPLIGLSTYRRLLTTTIGQRVHHALYECYSDAVMRAGGVPVLLPALESVPLVEMLAPLDGIILVGGGDVDPAIYGEEPHPTVAGIDATRDRFEIEIARWALTNNLPTLGICRGMQLINVAAGGTLIQDVSSQLGTTIVHRRIDSIQDPVHKVFLEANSRLAQVFQRPELEVNSGHHQSVGRLGEGFVVAARAEDGVIEGIESQNHSWVVGIQWHPEMMYEKYPSQLRLFSAFIEEAAKHRR